MIYDKVLNIAVVAMISPCLILGQYGIYEHGEEEDNDEERPAVDYSKYFGGASGSIGPDPSPQAVDGSAGFVQPLDFTGFFAGGQFGLDGLAGGASQQVFQIPVGVNSPLPVSGDSFVLRPEQNHSNSSGFVNGMDFRSMFDTTTSPSEHGFRPTDFLPRSAQGQGDGFYSPGFDTLQRDVDREVDYQRREETAIEQSRQANRRQPVEEEADDDLDEYDSSETDFDDPPLLDPNDRSPQKYTKQPYEEEREEKFGNSNTKRVSYNTPHSRVNHYHNPPTSQLKKSYKKPLPTLYESDDEYYSPTQNSNDKAHSSDFSSPKHGSSRTESFRNNHPNKNMHRSSPVRYNQPKYNKNNRQNPSPHSEGYQGRGQNHNTFTSVRPNHLTKPHSTRAPLDFRPSPRDPYLDSIRKVHNEHGSSSTKYHPSTTQRNHFPRQREFSTANKQPVQPITAASENKICHRINKKIDPKAFARFKRQQMTCYICKNKEKGNTYEECSYESEPKARSFFKGSAEAYSSDELISPTVYQIRERRSSNYPFEITPLPSIQPKTSLFRHRRQYDYDGKVKGHGSENYRFGPEFFQVSPDKVNKRKLSNRNPRRYDDDRDEYDDESEEESDIEKEYQPPGASEDDDCRKVKKDGLICMICTNSKSGGSYEQCSYASDPETNRYEYAKQSTYGSKRRPERYKRYTERVHNLNKEKQVKPHHSQRSILRRNDNGRDNYRNGKLKRKKVYSRDFHNKAIRKQNNNNKKNIRGVKEPEMPGVVGLDPFFYGSPGKTYNPDEYDERGKELKSIKNDSEDDEAEASTIDDESEEAVPTYEDAFFRLFPELEGTDPYTGESLSMNREGTVVNDRDNRSFIPYINDEEESESKQRAKKVKPDNPYGVELPSYYFDDDESKKDLERALDDFVQKNRSNCKKVMKEEMTCYQCINVKGMQHEECMFVAASEPQGKHLAYHEVKEFRVTPKENVTNQSPRIKDENKYSNESAHNPLPNVPEIKQTERHIITSNVNKDHNKIKNKPDRVLRKRSKVFPIVTEDPNHEVGALKPIESETQHAYIVNDILRLNPKEPVAERINQIISKNNPGNELPRRKRKPLDIPIPAESRSHLIRTRKKDGNQSINRSSEDEEEDKEREENQEEEDVKEDKPIQKEHHSKGRSNYNSVPPDPENFDEREGPEGAYSHDTEPVYDSRLKITLPKYMLARSEHEEIFDEVLRSG